MPKVPRYIPRAAESLVLLVFAIPLWQSKHGSGLEMFLQNLLFSVNHEAFIQFKVENIYPVSGLKCFEKSS
jgi:hypothetical protein